MYMQVQCLLKLLSQSSNRNHFCGTQVFILIQLIGCILNMRSLSQPHVNLQDIRAPTSVIIAGAPLVILLQDTSRNISMHSFGTDLFPVTISVFQILRRFILPTSLSYSAVWQISASEHFSA